MPVILPETAVADVICKARKEWMSQPEQERAFNELVTEHSWSRDKAKRTMTSRFRTMLKDHYGGVLWFRVLIWTGSIPHRMHELANVQLGQKTLEQNKAPASSRRPASAGEPIGSQHRVSEAKRIRGHAKKLMRSVREEADRRSYYDKSNMSDEAYAKLKEDADRAHKKAFQVSQASGHAYKLDGQAYGSPETSNFGILLADFCGEFHINVATGCLEDRPATLRKR